MKIKMLLIGLLLMATLSACMDTSEKVVIYKPTFEQKDCIWVEDKSYYKCGRVEVNVEGLQNDTLQFNIKEEPRRHVIYRYDRGDIVLKCWDAYTDEPVNDTIYFGAEYHDELFEKQDRDVIIKYPAMSYYEPGEIREEMIFPAGRYDCRLDSQLRFTYEEYLDGNLIQTQTERCDERDLSIGDEFDFICEEYEPGYGFCRPNTDFDQEEINQFMKSAYTREVAVIQSCFNEQIVRDE